MTKIQAGSDGDNLEAVAVDCDGSVKPVSQIAIDWIGPDELRKLFDT